VGGVLGVGEASALRPSAVGRGGGQCGLDPFPWGRLGWGIVRNGFFGRPPNANALWILTTVSVTALVTVLVLKSAEEPEEGPPLSTVGRASPEDVRMAVDAADLRDSALPADRWPRSCDLLSTTEINAILPDATGIGRRSQAVDQRGTAEIVKAGDRHVPANENALCYFLMRLPGDRAVGSTAVWVRIEFIGSEKAASLVYRALSGGTQAGGVPSADHCSFPVLEEDRWVCLKGSFVFSVGGWTARTFAEAPTAPATELGFWRDRVLSQVVETVAAKMT
jgi:hypothetical protein